MTIESWGLPMALTILAVGVRCVVDQKYASFSGVVQAILLGLLVGSPMDLYHRPQNRFVAAFLGSPRMNFLTVTIVGASQTGVTIQLQTGERFVVPFADRGLAPGSVVTLGIRPEHMHPVAAGDPERKLTRQVRQVERFGEYSYVYLLGEDDGTDALIAKVPGDCYATASESLSFAFDVSNCHIFDEQGLTLPRLTNG